MARIVFLQRIWYEFGGPQIISSMLKEHGHKVCLYIGKSAKDFLPLIHNKDIVAFSTMTGEHHWALATALALKEKREILTVFGGPHATFRPEMIQHPAVDIVCRGEGELALVDLADFWQENKDHTAIENLWVKKENTIIKNSPRYLIENLDSLPTPDRSIYDRYPLIRNSRLKTFIASRGCPHSCSFCFNRSLRQLYANKGPYVRFYSPDHLIFQIQKDQNKYPFKSIYFADDLFASNKTWLEKFSKLYRSQINKPFLCSSHINSLNEEIISLLKEAGCSTISFGIETGNQSLRQQVYNKKITNEQIFRIGSMLKKYKIKAMTFNIIGLPGETPKNTWETIKLNSDLRVEYPRCSLLTPYPGTSLAQQIDQELETMQSTSQQTSLFYKVNHPQALYNLHCFFQTAVLFPQLQWLIRKISLLPSNRFFKIWWAILYFIVFTRSEQRSPWQTLVSAIKTFGVKIKYA